MFTYPTTAQPYDELNTVIEMWFEDPPDGEKDANAPSAKFLMRGGVCWPSQWYPESETMEGCAVVAGMNLDTGRVYCFDEIVFCAVENIVDPDTRALIHPGVATWFQKAGARMFCDTWYINQPEDVEARWNKNVRDCASITVPVRFASCQPWGRFDEGENIVWEWVTRRRIEWWHDGPVDRAAKSHVVGAAGGLSPALHALAACLQGMRSMVGVATEVAKSPQVLANKVGNNLMRMKMEGRI